MTGVGNFRLDAGTEDQRRMAGWPDGICPAHLWPITSPTQEWIAKARAAGWRPEDEGRVIHRTVTDGISTKDGLT